MILFHLQKNSKPKRVAWPLLHCPDLTSGQLPSHIAALLTGNCIPMSPGLSNTSGYEQKLLVTWIDTTEPRAAYLTSPTQTITYMAYIYALCRNTHGSSPFDKVGCSSDFCTDTRLVKRFALSPTHWHSFVTLTNMSMISWGERGKQWQFVIGIIWFVTIYPKPKPKPKPPKLICRLMYAMIGMEKAPNYNSITWFTTTSIYEVWIITLLGATSNGWQCGDFHSHCNFHH